MLVLYEQALLTEVHRTSHSSQIRVPAYLQHTRRAVRVNLTSLIHHSARWEQYILQGHYRNSKVHQRPRDAHKQQCRTLL